MTYIPGGALPWLPAGSTELPAERFVLYADGANRVQLLNEAEVLGAGVSFNATWLSQCLNRFRLDRIYELKEVIIFYTAIDETTIVVTASGDGGASFPVVTSVNLLETSGHRLQQIAVLLGVTGIDLRIGLSVPAEIPVNITGFFPIIVERGRFNAAIREEDFPV